MLIWYEGDDSVVVDFCHGNSKGKDKKVFHRSAPSLLTAIKSDKENPPLKVYSEIILAAPAQLERHIVDAPRNLQQVRNAQKSVRIAESLSSDQLYNLIELSNETNFISDLQVVPFLNIVCFSEGRAYIT